MGENIDLKTVEKKIFKTSGEDGLLDIYLAILFIGMGFFGVFWEFFPLPWNIIILYSIILGIAFPFFYFAKKYITAPRTGIVKLSVKTSPTKKRLLLFLIINVIITFIMFIFTLIKPFGIQTDPIVTMLVIGLLFITLPISGLAYFLKTPRIYLTAIVMGLSLLVSEIIHPFIGSPFHFAIAFSISGTIVLIMGVVVLIRFLRKYPLPNEE